RPASSSTTPRVSGAGGTEIARPRPTTATRTSIVGPTPDARTVTVHPPGRGRSACCRLIEGPDELTKAGAQFGRVGAEADAEVGVWQLEPGAGNDQGFAVLGQAAVEVTAVRFARAGDPWQSDHA